MTVWIGTCPKCGPVRIESIAQPERCKTKVMLGKNVRTCQQVLTEVRGTRQTR